MKDPENSAELIGVIMYWGKAGQTSTIQPAGPTHRRVITKTVNTTRQHSRLGRQGPHTCHCCGHILGFIAEKPTYRDRSVPRTLFNADKCCQTNPSQNQTFTTQVAQRSGLRYVSFGKCKRCCTSRVVGIEIKNVTNQFRLESTRLQKQTPSHRHCRIDWVLVSVG